MNNAGKFIQVFGIYATELWAMTEAEFLKWLDADYVKSKRISDYIKRDDAIKAWNKRCEEQKDG